MKQSAYERAKDAKVADSEGRDLGYTPELMCAARGCPNRWTVGSTRLCSAHHWEPSERWPEITQQEQWNETERVRIAAVPKRPVLPLTLAGKTAILMRLNDVIQRMRQVPKDPKGWARKLKAREQEGERLSDVQRAAWREALRESHQVLNAVRDGADIDIDAINAALQITGDMEAA